MYITGSITDYVAFYYNVSGDKTNFVLPSILFLNCFFVVATSKLIPVVNPKIILAVGGIIGVLFLYISACMHSFGLWYIFYVLSWSIGNGTTYIVAIHHGWLWFPGKPGLISGIILAGFGLATLIFNNVAMLIVNPHHKSTID